MPKTRELAPEERAALIALRGISGNSYKQIEAQMRHTKSTVEKIVAQAHEAAPDSTIHLEDLSNLTHLKPRSGQPTVFTDEELKRLVEYATANHTNQDKPWVQCARKLGIEHSKKAIRNCFLRAGYERGPPEYKPRLNDQQKKARLDWCLEHQDKPVKGYWDRPVWSDKTAVRIGEFKGQQ